MGLLDEINKRYAKVANNFQRQNYGANDSLIASFLNHPLVGAKKGYGWLNDKVNTAYGIPNPYDNPNPLYMSNDAQMQAVNDLVGLIPMAGVATQGKKLLAGNLNHGTFNTFIGPKSATWDKKVAEKAEKLLNRGANPNSVWKKYLIGRMPDKSLFSEIDDSGVKYVDNFIGGARPGFADQLYQHKSLFNNYPEFKKIALQHYPGKNGGYDSAKKLINIGLDDADSVAAHEFQHAIQDYEGWASGGSPGSMGIDENSINDAKILVARLSKGENFSEAVKWMRENLKRSPTIKALDLASGDISKLYKMPSTNFEAYRRLAGEAQARATQDRLNMNLQQRRETYPLAGDKLSDIPLNQLIYKYGDDVPSMAISKPDLSLLEKYAGNHRAPIESESTAPLHDLTKILPDDIYSNKAMQYYGTGDDVIDREAFAAFNKYRGKPDALVNIYRAVPKNAEDIFNHGDWVTLSKKYAEEHGRSYLDDYKVIKENVPAKSLWTNGDSPHEFGLDVSKIKNLLASGLLGSMLLNRYANEPRN